MSVGPAWVNDSRCLLWPSRAWRAIAFPSGSLGTRRKRFKVSTIGTLYIVATPIGNLEDITLRALRVLKEADLIAAEDTRHTRKLLSHFEIKTPLISYHAHNQASRGPELIRRLTDGENVALVSDAGTPGFSDPGADLVARAWEAGVRVEAIPGPAAGVAALSLSGFKGDILFVGFLPRGEGRRLKMFQALAPEPRVIILYESPRRLSRTLTEIAGTMPNREVLVVRELTKKFEETWRGQVSDIARKLQDIEVRGECALVLSCPAAAAPVPPADLAGCLLKTAAESGLRGRRLADRVAGDLKAAPAAGLPDLPGPQGAGPGGVRRRDRRGGF